jgi:hypothetical protein
MHAIAAAALGLSLTLAAYAAEVAPKDGTPPPVQTAPRDTTQVPSNEQPQMAPDNRSDETVKDGSAREDDATYNLALRECQPLQSPERERCIEKAKEKHGRM